MHALQYGNMNLADVQFLNFFYKRIKENRTGRYEDTFPWVSLCGIERNFLRCDDTPLVYTELNGEELRVGQSHVYHSFLVTDKRSIRYLTISSRNPCQ